jgi:hypothetical protein
MFNHFSLQMALTGAFACLLLFAYIAAPQAPSPTSKVKGVAGRKIVRVDISKDVTLVLQLERSMEPIVSSNEDVALGLHSAQLVVNPKTCKNPGFWIRLVGPTLVNVHLVEDTSKATWTGSFSFPAQGAYRVDARWYGCNGRGGSLTPLPDPLTLQAVGSTVTTDVNTSLFSTGSSWTSTLSGDVQLPDYIWKNPEVPAQANNFVKTADSVVLKEGTVRQPNGFYAFKDLGNYELVW